MSQPDKSMRVRLAARFDLLTVELSAGFEVAALLLRPRGSQMFVCNGSGSAPFEVEEVELNASAELQTLLVRALT
jgi:hypothetical protein